jgi:hypothetical protein
MIVAMVLSVVPAYGQLNIDYGDGNAPGSDGSLDLTGMSGNFVINLAKAATGKGVTWDQTGGDLDDDGYGDGVYDHEQWAVVFKYTTVIIPSGVTVYFSNHPSRAPVVWLVQGDVIINGTLSLNGTNGHGDNVVATLAEPGPGGFRGGRGERPGASGSAGFGPGGADISSGDSNEEGSGGGYAVPGGLGGGGGGAVGQPYGNPGVFPLIGGSGGAGGDPDGNGSDAGGGGAGGGAILIATDSQVQLGGTLRANGGGGAGNFTGGNGSGGGIRIVADMISGGGFLQAQPGLVASSAGPGSVGRIRIEANQSQLVDAGNPPFSPGVPGRPPRIWPDTTVPRVWSVMLGNQIVPSDPRSTFQFPGADVQLPDGISQTLTIECENIPVDPGNVIVRLVRSNGQDTIYNAELESGDLSFSIWTLVFNVPDGFSSIQVRAKAPASP